MWCGSVVCYHVMQHYVIQYPVTLHPYHEQHAGLEYGEVLLGVVHHYLLQHYVVQYCVTLHPCHEEYDVLQVDEAI